MTGITFFQMDDDVDSGPTAYQEEETIRPDDTIATLYARIEQRGLELLECSLPLIASGKLPLQVQPNSVLRIIPDGTLEDSQIDWRHDYAVIHRWIRAQTRPYPGAFTHSKDGRLTIWACRPVAERPMNSTLGLFLRQIVVNWGSAVAWAYCK